MPLDLGRELIIDNFAGGGGTSTGLEAAFGRPVDIAINHDPEALAMHALNHPHTLHLCESVWDVHPVKVTQNRPVGLVWLSPDCFPAGTLVLTRSGYRSIETIQEGDEVLTHKGRWRRVTETSNTRRPILSIRGHGHPGLRVSPEHPFYVRAHQRDTATWQPASTIGKGMYWATPCDFPKADVPPIPALRGRGLEISTGLLWLTGRYVGDGWTRLTEDRAELVITCGAKEAEALRQILLGLWPRAGARSMNNEMAWHERTTRTAVQFSTNHRGLVEWLREHFGHRAEAKNIPSWALGMSEDLRTALLSGYLSADGSRTATFFESTTVSKALAFSVKALANSLGHTVGVYTGENSSVIEGRKVNARPYWRLRWRHEVDSNHKQTFRQAHLEWTPIRKRGEPSGLETVFNIGVEQDESYVVEGIVVHNCKHFSKAKGGTPVAKHIRGLAWVGMRWVALCKPRVLMLENVEEFQTWGPLLVGADGMARPDPARKGKTFQSFVRQLRAHGYTVDWRELRACDYGAPTIRKRLFLIARRDGLPIVWPEQTHAEPSDRRVLAGTLAPHRTAAECIDFDLPAESVFGRKRPLVHNTMRRVAKGLWRHVLTSGSPFIVGVGGRMGQSPERSVHAPAQTITSKADSCVAQPLLMPFLSEHANASNQRTMEAGEPLRTICAQVKGGHFSVVAPALEPLPAITGAHLVTIGYGERDGQQPRAQDIAAPLGTVVTANKHAPVAVHLVDMGHGEGASGATSALAAAFLEQANGGFYDGDGRAANDPMSTITASGSNQRLITAYLVQYYSEGGQDSACGRPMATSTTKARMGLVQTALVSLAMLSPDHAERARRCAELLNEHLQEHFPEPADVVLIRHQGKWWVLADITLRMLKPAELYRAQGFPCGYQFEQIPDPALLFVSGEQAVENPLTIPRIALSVSAQVRMVGNSVSPPMAHALVRANFAHEALV